MEKADYYEVFGALVECPYCGVDNTLDVGGVRYNGGDEVMCRHCKKDFELGESL